MISYADLEFAIDRWKARAAGIPQPAPTVASGTVAAQVPVATAPEEESKGESKGESTGESMGKSTGESMGDSTKTPSFGTPNGQG